MNTPRKKITPLWTLSRRGIEPGSSGPPAIMLTTMPCHFPLHTNNFFWGWWRTIKQMTFKCKRRFKTATSELVFHGVRMRSRILAKDILVDFGQKSFKSFISWILLKDVKLNFAKICLCQIYDRTYFRVFYLNLNRLVIFFSNCQTQQMFGKIIMG